MIVIADSTPLIYLATLGDFHLLRDLLGALIIPEAVYREVVVEGKRRPGEKEVKDAESDWIRVGRVKDPKAVRRLTRAQRFQAGESEAIVLYRQLGAQLLLLDEQLAVAYARGRRMNVVRTVGIYDLAKQRGLIASVREKLDHLRKEGFWLKDTDYEAILKGVGEA